jgi:hypothetical protein
MDAGRIEIARQVDPGHVEPAADQRNAGRQRMAVLDVVVLGPGPVAQAAAAIPHGSFNRVIDGFQQQVGPGRVAGVEQVQGLLRDQRKDGGVAAAHRRVIE